MINSMHNNYIKLIIIMLNNRYYVHKIVYSEFRLHEPIYVLPCNYKVIKNIPAQYNCLLWK
jgi:hypothetical protein